MKNVVVLYNHNHSAWFLREQRLNDRMGLAPNFNSCDFFSNGKLLTDEDTTEKHGMLSSTDTEKIQFYHFRHKDPKHPPQPGSPDDLRFWVDQVKTALTKGDHIDAVVIPGPMPESDAVIAWLGEMKQYNPALKVMVSDAFIDHVQAGPLTATDSRYVVAKTPEAKTRCKLEDTLVTKNDTHQSGCSLHPFIDVATRNLSEEKTAEVLRGMLGTQDMPSLSSGRHF